MVNNGHLAAVVQQFSYTRRQIQQTVAPTWQDAWLYVHFLLNQWSEESHEDDDSATDLSTYRCYLFLDEKIVKNELMNSTLIAN